jgi:hypothetical protein
LKLHSYRNLLITDPIQNLRTIYLVSFVKKFILGLSGLISPEAGLGKITPNKIESHEVRVEHTNKEPYLLIHYVSINQDHFVSRSAFLGTIEKHSLPHLKIELHSVLGLEKRSVGP